MFASDLTNLFNDFVEESVYPVLGVPMVFMSLAQLFFLSLSCPIFYANNKANDQLSFIERLSLKVTCTLVIHLVK